MAFADCIFIITRTKRNIVIPLSFKFVLTILPQFFSVLQEENSIFLKFSGKSAQRRVFEQSAVLFAVKAHNIDANVHLIARVLPLCFIEQ